MENKNRRWFPPIRWYWHPIVQFPGVFMALVGYQAHEFKWLWAVGGYVGGLIGMTAAYAREQLLNDD